MGNQWMLHLVMKIEPPQTQNFWTVTFKCWCIMIYMIMYILQWFLKKNHLMSELLMLLLSTEWLCAVEREQEPETPSDSMWRWAQVLGLLHQGRALQIRLSENSWSRGVWHQTGAESAQVKGEERWNSVKNCSLNLYKEDMSVLGK